MQGLNLPQVQGPQDNSVEAAFIQPLVYFQPHTRVVPLSSEGSRQQEHLYITQTFK